MPVSSIAYEMNKQINVKPFHWFTTEFERFLVYFYKNAIYSDVGFVLVVVCLDDVSLVVISTCWKWLNVGGAWKIHILKWNVVLCSAQTMLPFHHHLDVDGWARSSIHKILYTRTHAFTILYTDFILSNSTNAISYNCARRHALASSPVTLKCTNPISFSILIRSVFLTSNSYTISNFLPMSKRLWMYMCVFPLIYSLNE